MNEIYNQVIGLPNNYIFELASICISIINILTTILLAGVNLYFVQRNRKKDNFHKACKEYYFPLKYKLTDLLRDIKVFEKTYKIQQSNYYDLDYDNKKLLVEECIQPYLNYYNSLPKYCICSKLDSEIIKLNQYLATVIYTLGIQDNTQRDEFKKEYPVCNVEDLIQKINDIIKKNL